MNSHVETDRLYYLVSRMCDGDISAQEITELDSLMQDNGAAVGEYHDFIKIHYQLEQKLRTNHLGPENAAKQRGPTDDASSPDSPAKLILKRPSVRRGLFSLFAVAASLLVAAAFWILRERSERSFAARIEQLVDCDWDEVRWGPLQIATLDVGREIKFDHGLMMLEFGDGAEVTVEGPVRFQIVAADRMVLKRGKLTATVPRRGHGFAVQLPKVQIIDLGTKFGALVNADGSCEAHVFEGRVLVRSDLAQQPSDEFELTAGSAWRLPAGAISGQRIGANPASFVHATRFVDPTIAGADTPLTIPARSHLILWLNAAKRLQLDHAGNVVGWGNLCSSDDQEAAGNAWQLSAKERPTWLPDALKSLPAVRFDGSTYLVTTPLSTSNDVTVVCAFESRQHGADQRTGRILDLNGPANLSLEATEKNDLIARVSTSLENPDLEKAEALEIPLLEDDALWLAVYCYQHSSNRSELYLNGKLVGQAAASLGIAGRTPEYIGKSSAADNHFVGDLAELLVFNTALSANECRQISAQMMSKYGIQRLETEPRVLYRPRPSEP
jgi:Concanavalin A-like lectin/glucanases superfamily